MLEKVYTPVCRYITHLKYTVDTRDGPGSPFCLTSLLMHMNKLKDCQIVANLGSEDTESFLSCDLIGTSTLLDLLNALQTTGTLTKITSLHYINYEAQAEDVLSASDSVRLMRYAGQAQQLQALDLHIFGAESLWNSGNVSF